MSFNNRKVKNLYASVKRKNNDGTEKEILNGSVADASSKTSIPVNCVGVNLGVTMNMGNYQSLRIDVWSSDKIQRGETRKDAIFRVANDLANTLQELQDKYGGEDEKNN